jgi:hypothetical protein
MAYARTAHTGLYFCLPLQRKILKEYELLL